MKSLFTLSLAGVLALGIIAAPAIAAPVTLKMANVTSQSAKDAGIEFKKIAEEASGGTLKVELFPDNQPRRRPRRGRIDSVRRHRHRRVLDQPDGDDVLGPVRVSTRRSCF